MIVYLVDPIDHWSGWQKPDDVFREGGDYGDRHTLREWANLWLKAQSLARSIGWEGDIREGPYVTVLPNRPGDYWPGAVIIAWKQGNNGTTFIASELPLPWIAAGAEALKNSR